eukprot:scaffold4093_cov166-Amphora_coffeaeformis.AAC.5
MSFLKLWNVSSFGSLGKSKALEFLTTERNEAYHGSRFWLASAANLVSSLGNVAETRNQVVVERVPAPYRASLLYLSNLEATPPPSPFPKEIHFFDLPSPIRNRSLSNNM